MKQHRVYSSRLGSFLTIEPPAEEEYTPDYTPLWIFAFVLMTFLTIVAIGFYLA